MRAPKEIDGSFQWDQNQMAWVQGGTGLTVTDIYVRHMGLIVTSEARENRRKAIEALRKKSSLVTRSEPDWQPMTRQERVEFIKSLEKKDGE